MGKSHQKNPPKMPPSKGAKTRTSLYLKTTECERGSGLFGRGGKTPSAKQSMGSEGRQLGNMSSSSSSASESDKDDELDEDGKCHHGGIGIKTSKITTREELLTMLREKEWAIKKLRAEMVYTKNKSKPSKQTVREIVNFSKSKNTYVQEFLFLQYKFLKEG